MREATLTAQWVALLRRQGAMVYPLIAGRDTPEDWPDRYVAHEWWQGFVELKTKRLRLQPGQALVIRMLRERYVNVHAVRLFDDQTLVVEDTDGGEVSDVIPWHQMLRFLQELDG